MRPELPAKDKIRRAFEQAAAGYDAAAAIQRQICDTLLAGLPPTSGAHLLDAGCGTGYALPQLQQRYPNAECLALDLAPAMLARTPTSCLRMAGDLESLPLADASLDLYWSSLALQWCRLPQALSEAARTLKTGGHLAIATLGPQTFHELRTVFASADGYTHTIGFCTAQTIQTTLEAHGLTLLDIRQQPYPAYFPTLSALLRSVKTTGANQLGSGRRQGLMSRSAWQTIEAAYETLRTSAGLPLTYDAILIQAKK